MARGMRLGWAVALGAAGGSGCVTAPPVDNPAPIRTAAAEAVENPVLVSPGVPTSASYREVFEKCIDVLDDYFEIEVANPYAGVILTKPRIAPGYEQVWKGGNPDPRSRLLATLQTVRQTAAVEVRTGERGGYLVYVTVEKEMEDLARPTRQVGGGAVFTEAPTVDRRVEVVGPASIGQATTSWFRIGRDYAFEQQILQRVRACR